MSVDPCRGAEQHDAAVSGPGADRGRGRRASTAPARVRLLQRPLRLRAAPARGRQGLLLRRARAGRVRRAAAAALLRSGRSRSRRRPAGAGRGSRPRSAPSGLHGPSRRCRGISSQSGARDRRTGCERPRAVVGGEDRRARRRGAAGHARDRQRDRAPARRRARRAPGRPRRAARRARRAATPPGRRRQRSHTTARRAVQVDPLAGSSPARAPSTTTRLGARVAASVREHPLEHRPAVDRVQLLHARRSAGPRRPRARRRRSHVLDERVRDLEQCASPRGVYVRAAVSSSMRERRAPTAPRPVEQLGDVGQLAAAVGVACPQREPEAPGMSPRRDHMSVWRHDEVVVDAQPLERHGALARRRAAARAPARARRGPRARRCPRTCRPDLVVASRPPGAARAGARAGPSPACRRARRLRTRSARATPCEQRAQVGRAPHRRVVEHVGVVERACGRCARGRRSRHGPGSAARRGGARRGGAGHRRSPAGPGPRGSGSARAARRRAGTPGSSPRSPKSKFWARGCSLIPARAGVEAALGLRDRPRRQVEPAERHERAVGRRRPLHARGRWARGRRGSGRGRSAET